MVLILDTAKQSQSVAAVVAGFANHRADVRVVGVILNNTGSARHEAILTGALASSGLPTLGAVRRQSGLEHPSRHLGLVQASERPDLEAYLERVADQAPPACDLVFLPGGYPELHAGRLAGNGTFLGGLRKAGQNTRIYGDCGGYMVLGEGLVDADGKTHAMAGLLALETSFAARKLHLGYRHLTALGGPFAGKLTAHEFHYASTVTGQGTPLFKARNAEGDTLPDMGLINGRVSGSFAHVIDRA